MVADETVATEPNEGKVTSVVSEDIVSGISRVEAEGLGVQLIGLDVDAMLELHLFSLWIRCNRTFIARALILYILLPRLRSERLLWMMLHGN